MSDQSSSTPTGAAGPAPRPRSRLRTTLVVAAIALVGGLIGVTATRALSHGMFGPGFGHHGFMHGGGPMDPDRAQRRAERFMRHMAVELDATTEQQEKLAGIARETVKDLLPIREEFLAGRKRALELLAQPTVDRAAIESLRSEQIARADAASRRFARGIADAAEVLTPEQRKKLAERAEEMRERRGWGRGWWHRG
jgi:Spy/CpxP family protein refolding chaperone